VSHPVTIVVHAAAISQVATYLAADPPANPHAAVISVVVTAVGIFSTVPWLLRNISAAALVVAVAVAQVALVVEVQLH
jgi:ABC-type Na+ efflux pump permease subunit